MMPFIHPIWKDKVQDEDYSNDSYISYEFNESNEVEIHAIDLPLFGRSRMHPKDEDELLSFHDPDSPDSPDISDPSEKILDFYKECILSYIRTAILILFYRS